MTRAIRCQHGRLRVLNDATVTGEDTGYPPPAWLDVDAWTRRSIVLPSGLSLLFGVSGDIGRVAGAGLSAEVFTRPLTFTRTSDGASFRLEVEEVVIKSLGDGGSKLLNNLGLERFLYFRWGWGAEYRIPYITWPVQVKLERFLRDAGISLGEYIPPWHSGAEVQTGEEASGSRSPESFQFLNRQGVQR